MSTKQKEWKGRRHKRMRESLKTGALRTWNQHSAYHYSKTINGQRVDVWPSGHKFMVNGMVYHVMHDFKGVSKLLPQRIVEEDFSLHNLRKDEWEDNLNDNA